MPSYASFVALLTDASPVTRNNGLSSLLAMVDDLSLKKRLLILKEGGMLAALAQFLTPASMHKTGEVALAVIRELINQRDPTNLTDAEQECKQIVFSSPLMPRIVAATSVHWQAYGIIARMSLSDALKKDLFEYSGVAEALSRGLQTDVEFIHDYCIITIAHTCGNATLDHVFDHALFPELVAGIINTFCTHGLGNPFKGGCFVLKRLANSDERSKQLLLAYPDLVTSVKAVIQDVVETEDNKLVLAWARELLARFNDKMRLACAEESRKDKEKLLNAAEQEIKMLKSTNEELAAENKELRERNLELENVGPAQSELEKSPTALDLREALSKENAEPAAAHDRRDAIAKVSIQGKTVSVFLRNTEPEVENEPPSKRSRQSKK
jgi:hypothetical protein